jgi:hypothetical protein
MSPYELDILRGAIQTIADAKGNWLYGWQSLCKLAELNPDSYPPPFREHPLTGTYAAPHSHHLPQRSHG